MLQGPASEFVVVRPHLNSLLETTCRPVSQWFKFRPYKTSNHWLQGKQAYRDRKGICQNFTCNSTSVRGVFKISEYTCFSWESILYLLESKKTDDVDVKMSFIYRQMNANQCISMDRSFRSSIIAIRGVTTASIQGADVSLTNGKKMNRSSSSQNRIANGAAGGVGRNLLSFIATPDR